MTSARRRAASLVVTGLAVAATLGANGAMAQTPGHGTGPGLPSAGESVASGAARESHSVTLLTGDRVTISSVEGGGRMVTVDPGPERDGVGFVEQETEGGLHVVPTDALGLVAAGRVDARLFDVAALIEQGFDDSSSEQLPLIVRYEDRPRTQEAKPDALTVAGAQVDRELPSIDGAAVRVSKEATARLWEQLTDEGRGVQALRAGIAEVRLDGRVQASLDESAEACSRDLVTTMVFPKSGLVSNQLILSLRDTTSPTTIIEGGRISASLTLVSISERVPATLL